MERDLIGYENRRVAGVLGRKVGPIIGGELSESQKLREARVSLNLADSGHGPVTRIVAPIV